MSATIPTGALCGWAMEDPEPDDDPTLEEVEGFILDHQDSFMGLYSLIHDTAMAGDKYQYNKIVTAVYHLLQCGKVTLSQAGGGE